MRQKGTDMVKQLDSAGAFSDRAHGDALKALLLGHLLRLEEGHTPTSEDKRSVAHQIECYAGLLMACSIMERSIVDLCWHQSQLKHSNEAPPPLLKDLFLSHLVADILPSGAAQWLSVIFSPWCTNVRNIAWHGFLTWDQAPSQTLSLLLLLSVSLPKAPRREWIQPGPFAAHFTSAPIITHLLELKPSSIAALEHLFRSSPFVSEGHKPLLLHALTGYSEGRATFFCNLALCVLEHALRLLFAHLHACPRIAVVRGSEYMCSVDGYGQALKRQVLLAKALHPSLRSHRLPIPIPSSVGLRSPLQPSSSSSESAILLEPEEQQPRSLSTELEEEEEENKLIEWLGPGALACLKVRCAAVWGC